MATLGLGLKSNHRWLGIVFVATVYLIAAWIGFLLPFDGEIVTLIWPASGIALAVLLLFGLDLWPAIAMGSAMIAVINYDNNPLLVLGIVLAYTFEPVFAAYILRKYTDFNNKLEKFSDVFYLFICGFLAAPAIGATLGVLSFAIVPNESTPRLALLWWHWWNAHSLSMAIVVPLLITWFSQSPKVEFGHKFYELLLTLGLLSLVSALIFIRIDYLPIGNYPLGHVIFPFLLWIALRFTPREVATGGFITAMFAMIGTIQKTGPFSRQSLDLNLVLLATFVFSVIIVTLMLSSLFVQRRRTREELQISHDDLERRVETRTVELHAVNQQLMFEVEEHRTTTEALAKARDEALVALNYKNQILANVSHDARTPLNIITLNTDLIKRRSDNLTEKQVSRLDTISLSSRDLLNFINNLLDAANIQAEQATPELRSIAIHSFFDAHHRKLQELAHSKNLDFNIQIDANVPGIITSDVQWLDKILINLVSNAIKFTRQGGIEICVTAPDENQWQLIIQDSGIGIPEDALEQIFAPFWQVDGSTTREANRGVGLGLSIVHRYITLLGGTIDVDSITGQGTTFTLRLPLVEKEKSYE